MLDSFLVTEETEVTNGELMEELNSEEVYDDEVSPYFNFVNEKEEKEVRRFIM